MTTPLPPLPTPEATHWETNQWGHAALTASDAYTAEQMCEYAQQARADLEAENADLKRKLEEAKALLQDIVETAADMARAALERTK